LEDTAGVLAKLESFLRRPNQMQRAADYSRQGTSSQADVPLALIILSMPLSQDAVSRDQKRPATPVLVVAPPRRVAKPVRSSAIGNGKLSARRSGELFSAVQ